MRAGGGGGGAGGGRGVALAVGGTGVAVGGGDVRVGGAGLAVGLALLQPMVRVRAMMMADMVLRCVVDIALTFCLDSGKSVFANVMIKHPIQAFSIRSESPGARPRSPGTSAAVFRR